MLSMADFEKAFRSHVVGIQDVSAEYAVLVPLVQRDKDLYLLFEQRADTLVGHQPSEVCFPGGRLEEGELPLDAALRETWEELRIPSEDIRLIAPLDVMVDLSYRVIHPFLAQVDVESLTRMVPNPGEVKEAFLVPVSALREEPYIYRGKIAQVVKEDFPYDRIGFPPTYPWRYGKLEVPIYQYGSHSIWGLTGRIVLWMMRHLDQTEK